MSKGTTLITGASKGIGYELTKKFAENNHDVVLVARSVDKLNKFKKNLEEKNNINAYVFPKDLSEPGSARELYEDIVDEGIVVDILVNNAGFSIFGNFIDTDIEQERDMIQLNLVSLTELTKYFLKSMKENEGGKILNHASTSAAYPIPKMAVYSSVKSYIVSFSVALDNELSNKNINVTALCTPETDTELFEKGGMEDSKLSERDLLDPEEVASQGYEALMNNETIVVPGSFKNKLLFNLPRFLSKNRAASIANDYVAEK